jgi:hypothetical protein
MITAEKLRIYCEFDGDIDGWVRMSKGRGSGEMTDRDWFSIDEILQPLSIVHAGMASPEYASETQSKLNAIAEYEEVQRQLTDLAMRRS